MLGLLRLRSLLLLRGSCLWRRLCGRWLWFLRSSQGNREGAGAPEMPGQGLGDVLTQFIFDHIFGVEVLGGNEGVALDHHDGADQLEVKAL